MSLPTPMELMTEKYERAQRHIAELKKLISDMESGQIDLENPVRALDAVRLGAEVSL
jgi:exonuclease VII small subunit